MVKSNILGPYVRVLEADSAESALQHINDDKVDLVLTDMKLPRSGGVTLIREIRNNNSEIPLVVFLSDEKKVSYEEAFDLGAAAVFTKPFDRQELKWAIAYLLEHSREKWVMRPPRYQTDQAMKVQFSNLESAIQAHIFNIGRGGAFIKMNEGFPSTGTQVNFSLKLGENEPELTGVGIVRWVRTTDQGEDSPAGIGLEFLFVDEPGRSRLRELLDRLGRPQYIPKN